ncbi:MAG: type II toxin-antitoxin system RatA family toxin [Robiginitomaculum sp.]|nr:type II toxin-antitoxin system RatA family toxin [Robiginitomaculum sp.]
MRIHRQKRLFHKPEDLLEMVIDVENYPKFINFISSVRILKRENLSASIEAPTTEALTVDVAVQYKFISETFRSLATADRENLCITIEKSGHGGAVRTLTNTWIFHPLSDGSTQLDFTLDVNLKLAPLQFLARGKIDGAAKAIMNAFERRAKQICEPAGDKAQDLRMV